MKTIIKTKSAFGTLLPLVACGMAALACVTSHAQLLSSEPFSGYTVGTQVTADMPSPTVAGYTGDGMAVHFGTVHPTTTAGSLAYGGAGYAASIGNHIAVPTYTGGIAANNSGRMYRLLDSSLAVTSATTGTRYLSFLYQSGQEGVQRFTRCWISTTAIRRMRTALLLRASPKTGVKAVINMTSVLTKHIPAPVWRRILVCICLLWSSILLRRAVTALPYGLTRPLERVIRRVG